jgi:hypothetical protein
LRGAFCFAVPVFAFPFLTCGLVFLSMSVRIRALQDVRNSAAMPARQARLDVRDVLEVLHHVACGDPRHVVGGARAGQAGPRPPTRGQRGALTFCS